MTKLLVSCGSLTSGGAERVLSILSLHLADAYSQVTYLMWVDAPVFYEIDKRITIVSVEKECGSTNILKKMLWFRRYVKNHKPDLLLSFLTPFNILSLFSLLGVNQKVVVAERNDPFQVHGGWPIAKIRNLLYHKASGILVQTAYAGSCFKGSLSRKTHVIYNPILMEESEVGSALSAAKEDVIISVGRLEPQKDQKTLIDAFGIFIENHPTYQLHIYGEGSIREELEMHIAKSGLHGKVILPGTTKDIWNKLRASRTFVLSSLMEGMSNAMIEAMCLGVPVVSTKVAGATDLIKDGENGYLVDQKNPQAIADRLAQIADSKELSEKLGKNSAELYKILSTKVIIPQWIYYVNSQIFY